MRGLESVSPGILGAGSSGCISEARMIRDDCENKFGTLETMAGKYLKNRKENCWINRSKQEKSCYICVIGFSRKIQPDKK